jgi:hypothetical protein
LNLIAGAARLPLVPRTAGAQVYPARTARLLVGFAAGGSGDLLARLMAQWLSDRLKQTFIVENKVGAGGNIATDNVLRSLFVDPAFPDHVCLKKLAGQTMRSMLTALQSISYSRSTTGGRV